MRGIGTLDAETVRAQARDWFADNWDPDLPLGEWWKRLADAGWGLPTWPREWFGRGLQSDLANVVAEERRRAGAVGPPSGIGTMMAGPTLVEHGTDEQKQRFLPSMVYGEHVWCQLFSEPGAGSDLAGLQTKAERHGDEWIVNGQKVWTSGAQFAKWGILIARTDADVPKHQGITYFVIDIDQPGVEVRPLREMTGGATFNEVFLTDARVPGANVIGEVNGGWGVAITTLAHERRSLGAGAMSGMSGGAMFGRTDLSVRAGELASGGGGGELGGMAALFGGGDPKMLVHLARGLDKWDDPRVRQDIAQLYTLLEIARYTSLRAQAAAARGNAPGPEVSTGKLAASRIVRALRDTGLRILGPHGMLFGSDAPMGGMLQFLSLFAPAVSIAGGTDEVQRNIVGERVLGFPSEPRIDKDVPFRDLKVGTQR